MAQINEQIRINASFYFDDNTSDATPAILFEPTSVLFEVIDSLNTTILSAAAILDGSVYYYNFTPTEEGEYTVRFTASFTDADDLVIEENISVGLESATPIYLDSDFTISFATYFTPLYLDPAELSLYFPDLTDYEIAEAIHMASIKVRDLFGLKDGEDPPAYAIDFVQAHAACSLSRLADDLFGSGAYTKDDFTLGDLTVKDSSGSSAKSKISTGNAANWCELAYSLEIEMKMKSTSAKPFVKSSKYSNPVPERRLPSRFGGRGVIKDTGRIDD